MLRTEVRHIFRTGRPTNFKLGTQTKHEDPHQRQGRDLQSQSSQGHVMRPSKPKLVGRLYFSRAIMHTSFKVKGQRSRSPGRLMLTQ